MNEKVYPAGQYVAGDKKAKEEGRAGIGLGDDDWNVKTLER